MNGRRFMCSRNPALCCNARTTPKTGARSFARWAELMTHEVGWVCPLTRFGFGNSEPRPKNRKMTGAPSSLPSSLRALGSRTHSSIVVSPAPSSAMWTASRLAGSVALAFSLSRCSLPGGSKKLSPARYTLAGPVAEFCERIAPAAHRPRRCRRGGAAPTCRPAHR